jgi:NADH:ubiquinone oxidoreductase subunit 4 (subunit M)
VLALWGVVISTVYMLRAYRKTFMGTLSDRWKDIVDLRPPLRIPVILVIGGLLCYGFFPQSLVQTVTPVLRTYLTTDRHLTHMESYSYDRGPDPSASIHLRGCNIRQIAVR